MAWVWAWVTMIKAFPTALIDTLSINWKGRPMLHRATLIPLILVFFGGINLSLIQWVLVREMTALLLGTEIVVLLVSVSYFIGLSVGYQLAGRIRRTWLVPLGIVTLVLHLTLPIWFRVLAAELNTVKAYALAFLVLPLLTPFIISAFYSIFLPLFVDQGEGQLSKLYALEVLGSAAGIGLLVALSSAGLNIVYFVYTASLLLILGALGLSYFRLILLSVISIAWLVIFPNANTWSNTLWYRALQKLPEGTVTLFSGYSPYQKVDVLETPSGSRYLYLDGLNHFGTYDGQRLNVVSGQIPASLTHPANALVFGAGSMQMAAMIADYAGHVTTVELDPLVVDVSRKYFQSVNRLDVLSNRSIIVDDAKHFIANSRDHFDFIATDLPAAYSIQTATLYSAPFYRAVKEHLNPGGIFVANLTSPFAPDNTISRRIVASLLENFAEVIVVTPHSVGWSFAYASDHLPFDRKTFESALRNSGETEFVIYETGAVRMFVGQARPITLDSMDIALEVSLDWIRDRLR